MTIRSLLCIVECNTWSISWPANSILRTSSSLSNVRTSGRTYAVLTEQQTEFESRAAAYQKLAREIAATELQQLWHVLDSSHREAIGQIMSHVSHEDTLAMNNSFAVNQQLWTTGNHAHNTRPRPRHTSELTAPSTRSWRAHGQQLPPVSVATQLRCGLTSPSHNRQ